MSDQTGAVVARLRCWVGSHTWTFDRAEDREPGGCQRLYPREDREPEPIDACYVVEQCARCGNERRVYSSVDTAERLGATLMWDRSVDTDPDRGGGEDDGE